MAANSAVEFPGTGPDTRSDAAITDIPTANCIHAETRARIG